MSQGRPTNPPKGTPRPGEPSRPEAGKGPEASKTPEAGKAPGAPTGSAAGSSSPAQAGAAKPGNQPPASKPPASQPPSSPAAPAGQPPAAKPGDPKPGDAKSSAGPAAGGRPTTSGAGGGPSGGTGSGGSGAGGTGAGGTGSGGTGSGGRTPPPPAAAPASRGGGWVPGVVGGVVGAVLAVFGAPLVQGPPPLGPEAQSRIAEVESDTAAIAERVAALQSLADDIEPAVRTAVEEAIAEVPSRDGAAIAALGEEVEALTATTTALDAQVTEVAGRLDAIESEVERQLGEVGTELGEMIRETREAASAEVSAAQAALGDELEALRGQLATAEAELAAVQGEVAVLQQARSRAAAAALLVRDIDRSIDNGTPFAEPLGYLIPMAEEDATLTATLEELRPYAESGVPTMQQLRDDLLALAETEAPGEIAGSEFLGQAVQNLYGLVQVRSKEDEVDVASGLLADADSALRAGDIATAIEQVEAAAEAPNGVDPELAESWLADARARLVAVDARAQLDAHIRELLTATIN